MSDFWYDYTMIFKQIGYIRMEIMVHTFSSVNYHTKSYSWEKDFKLIERLHVTNNK